jgi:hypothetical protein
MASPVMPARSRAPAMATPPRSIADSGEKAPRNFPIGVRAMEEMTVLMRCPLLAAAHQMLPAGSECQSDSGCVGASSGGS